MRVASTFAFCSARIGVALRVDPGVEEHDLLLQSPTVSRGKSQLLRTHFLTGAEADVADPAERGDVLVLLADGLPAVLDLDSAGPVADSSRRADTCRPWYANSACSRPTVTADDEPRPEPPADGMSARVVISMPFATPVIRMASRTSSCSRSSTCETISFF